jgi:hypothetical protein
MKTIKQEVAAYNKNLTIEIISGMFDDNRLDQLKGKGARQLKGITIDFIEKYQEKINITDLTGNYYIEKDIIEYLIEKFPDQVSWESVFEHIRPTFEVVKENWDAVRRTSYTPLLLCKYKMETELVDFLLTEQIKHSPETIIWHTTTSRQNFNYKLFKKYYKYIDADQVLRGSSVSTEERNKMEKYHQLKSIF